MLWDFLCFPIKEKRGTRSADPRMMPNLIFYQRGMIGINFRIWRKKTERAVTRQHASRPIGLLYHDMTRNKRPTAWQHWHGHKGITLPGNDIAVEKNSAKTCCFVKSKNGLSLSQIVAVFLSVFCRLWIRKDCHHIFEQCHLSPKPLGRPQLLIHIVRKSTPRFTKSPSLVLIGLVLTEIQRFENVKISKEMYGQRPDVHTFLCKFWHLGLFTPNLGIL